MSSPDAIRDIALSGVITDLFTQARLLDMDLKNDLELEQRSAALTALRTYGGDAALLTALDTENVGGVKWGETYRDMSQPLRNSVAHKLCQKMERDLQSKCVLSTESLSTITRTVAGRVALKVGLIAGTAVTIGVYKRQLIEMLSDTVAEVSLLAANFKEKQLALGKKVRGTPTQVNRQISTIKGIVSETDKLQKTIVDIGADKLSVNAARQQVNQSIERLTAYGVPMDKAGAAATPSKEQLSPYEATDANKSEWNAAALTTAGAALSQVEQQVKSQKEMASVTGGDDTLSGDLRKISIQAQRAMVRSSHYVLFLMRKLMQVLHNVRFIYSTK